MSLKERIEAIAHHVADREGAHLENMIVARAKAEALHGYVADAIGRFNEILVESVPYLRIEVSPPRVDDKHLHAIEFNLERGRHRAVVTVKSKGEVTFVGPFRSGKKEGPCRSFPLREAEEIEDALGDFVERFLEAATSP